MKRNSVAALWMALAFATALGLTAAVMSSSGTDAESTRQALRLTARWSFLLFWMAYAGGALAVLLGPPLAPLARRGRELGLGFAASLLVHIGLLVWLYWITGHPPLTGRLLVFFMIGLFATYLLAVLSFGGLAQALGPGLWRLVRILGMNYILLAFTRDFVLAVIRPDIMQQDLWYLVDYVPFAALSVTAPLLSLAATARRNRTIQPATA